jgi:hypothetical protein
MSQSELLEGMQALSIAWQQADEETRIPLMTRVRALPEIIGLMNDAEVAGLAGETGAFCARLNAAPLDLREAVLKLREVLLPAAGPAPCSGPLGYYINLDERGDFFADLRKPCGESVFEIRACDDGAIDLIEDGFMAHKTDIAGLREHLVDMKIIDAAAEVLGMADFEARLEVDEAPGPEL